jgi:hypothetical protein
MPEEYSKKEAEQRFEAALRGALKTPPQPMKDKQKKRVESKRKRKPAKASA